MYTPLKVTTDYSILKSLIKVSDLINFCMQKNIKSCAICDTNLFGTMEFYKLAKKNNIKPIIGLEINYNNSSIYLYAKNYAGYKNMLKINTLINDIITINILKKYASDILVIIPYKSINLYDELNFYEDVYVSYQNELELKNALIKTDNVVFVNDIKAFNKEELKYLKVLNELNEEQNDYDNYYFINDLKEIDRKRIDKVVDKLNCEIPFNERYIPKFSDSFDSFTFLSQLALKGLNKRLNKNVGETYLNRLKYELSVIKKMGFVDYFLIVYDYVLYAKKNNILVGPGRGSAAGSLVSYSIGITDIDPIKYDLLFERFLNYERVTMPDIDIDFENLKREEVINYVKEKYGTYNVAGGLTYTTLKSRLVLRDISKLLKIDEILFNKFIKVINRNLSLKENLENPKVQEYLKRYNDLNNVYNISLHLEGLKKNISTHAAGIVISDRILDEVIPMYKKEDIYLTGCPMEYLEDIGLLKMDFLALKNLTTISSITSNIPNFKLDNIPLDDYKTYELLCSADTDGVFQFETGAFKKVLKEYKPSDFLELIALVALVRPGPYKELEEYIKRKNGEKEISYYDDSLKSILEETYGVIVYQEQVINILVKMASYSYAEADIIRRAMSKKKEDIILKEKDNFIKRAVANNYSKDVCEIIFNHILSFASYGFNKAHSVSYAYISYRMAYLKANYPVLFTLEMINNSLGNINEINSLLTKLKRCDININYVDINISTEDYLIKNNTLYLPFKMIKNMSNECINNILKERNDNGIFLSIYDFFRRTSEFLNRQDYLLLIKSGSLSYFKLNTKTLEKNLDKLINYSKLYLELKEVALEPKLDIEKEYDDKILKENEEVCYGFYISNHPASKYLDKNVVKLQDVKNYEFKNIICYVLVENIKNIKTKKNEDMAFLLASDETDAKEFTIFPKNYYLLQNIKKNDMIKIHAYVSKRFSETSIVVNNIIKETK